MKKNATKRTIGQAHARYEDALLAIVAFIDEHNKRYGRPGKKPQVHMIAGDVLAIYEIAKEALK